MYLKLNEILLCHKPFTGSKSMKNLGKRFSLEIWIDFF